MKAPPTTPQKKRSPRTKPTKTAWAAAVLITVAVATAIGKFAESGVTLENIRIKAFAGGSNTSDLQNITDSQGNLVLNQQAQAGDARQTFATSSAVQNANNAANPQNVHFGSSTKGVNNYAPGGKIYHGPSPKQLKNAIKSAQPDSAELARNVAPQVISKVAEGLEKLVEEFRTRKDALRNVYPGGYVALPFTPELERIVVNSEELLQANVDWPSVSATQGEGANIDFQVGLIDQRSQSVIQHRFYLNTENEGAVVSELDGVAVEARVLNPGDESPVLLVGLPDASHLNGPNFRITPPQIESALPDGADNAGSTRSGLDNNYLDRLQGGSSTGNEGSISIPPQQAGFGGAPTTGGGNTGSGRSAPETLDGGSSVGVTKVPPVQDNGSTVGVL